MTSPANYSEEQLNYFRICHVRDHVTDGLRTVFKQEWDARYKTSHGKWNDSAKNGNDFYSLIPATEQALKAKELSIIRNGNREEWDCTCLFYAILYSKCIGKNKLDKKVKKAVDDLRQYRNKYAHYHESRVSDADFQASMHDVINAFDDLKLDTNAIQLVKSQTSFPTDELQNIRKQLGKEKRRNQEPQTFCDLPPKPTHEVIKRSSEVEAIMKEMKTLQSLHPNEVTHVYLSGNPGCGKSEAARQIGEKFFNETESASSKKCVATLNASSVDTMLKSYTDFARLLRIEEEYIPSIEKIHPNPEKTIQQLMGLVNSKLSLFSSWLVIVDNVVNLKMFSNFFPCLGKTVTAKAQILVTTQDRESIPPASPTIYHQSLSEGMKPDDAVDALCTIAQQFQDKEVVFEISKFLDYQPLALACTAVYMRLVNQNRYTCTWTNCLQKLNEGYRENIEKPFEASSQVYSKSMTTAVKMALDRVVGEDKVMMFAFQILSVLAKDPIPIKYALQYVLQCMADEDEQLIEAHIAHSSLVLVSGDGQDVHIHQIVHSILQDIVRHTVESDSRSVANIVKSFLLPDINDDEELDCDLTSIKSLTSHFVALQKLFSANLESFKAMDEEEALLVAKSLSCSIGKICHINGQLKAAKSYLEMAIAIKENCCTEHLVERNTLGEILYDLQDFKSSILCFEQALPSRDYVPPKNSKDCALYLRVLTNLWLVLSKVEKCNEAETCLKKALPRITRLFPGIQFAGKILSSIAMVYFYLGNYEEAKKFMEEALDLDKRKYGDSHPFVSERYNNLALVLKSKGEHKKAEEYLREAVSVGTSFYEENHPYLSTYYGNLGNVLRDLGQYEQAKEYIEKAIAIDEHIYDENNPALANDLNDLALVFRDLRQYEEAKECMERALAIDKHTCEENDPTLAIHLDTFGLVLRDLEMYEEAKECIQKSHAIGMYQLRDLGQLQEVNKCMKRALALDELEDNQPALAVDLIEIGSVLRDLRQYEQAKKCMERAVAIDERVYDANHPTLATHLAELGLVLRDLREYKEAKKYLERAVAIDERVHDENHPTLAIHLAELGLVLRELRKYEEAKKYMERAVAIDERVYDDNHPTFAIHLSELGWVLTDLGQCEEAKKYIERAVAIDERVYDDNHPTLAIHLNNLGLVLRDLREYEEAKKYMERAVAIDERVYGDNHPELATDLNNLGLVLRDLRQYEEAKKYLEKAVAIDERVYDANHPTLAIHLAELGLVLRHLREYEEAKKYMERAVAIDERIYDDNHPILAIHVAGLGLVLRDLREYEEAKKYLKKAVAIDERIYGDNHPTLAAIHLHNFSVVLKDLGQYEEAKKCIERAIAIDQRICDDNHPERIELLQDLQILLNESKKEGVLNASKKKKKTILLDESKKVAAGCFSQSTIMNSFFLLIIALFFMYCYGNEVSWPTMLLLFIITVVSYVMINHNQGRI